MQVTDVRVSVLETDNAVRGIGSFVLDGAFAVRGVRVMENKDGGFFVSFPSRSKADGTYEDLAFPRTKELYAHITQAVVDAYKAQVQKQELDRQVVQGITQDNSQEITPVESEVKAAPKAKAR